MSNKENEPWVDSKGMPITFEDCREACQNAVSCMSKALVENPVLVKDLKTHLQYKRQIEVMEKIRDAWDMAAKKQRKVQKKTVKGRGKPRTH